MGTLTLIPGFNPKELVEQGWTHYQIDPSLVDDANTEATSIINRFKSRLKADREFFRPGEDEADIGLIRKDGKEGRDDKYYLHHPHDFHAKGSELRECKTPALTRLYEANCRAAAVISSLLSDCFPEYFPRGLADNYWRSKVDSIPFGTTTLRCLYYPQTPGAPKVQGAKKHLDRGFLTQHQGDAGGELIALADEDDKTGVPVSPARGQTLVFFGVKVLYVTGGKVRPLWHGSRTEPGVDRRAIVQFGHVDVGKEIKTAEKAYLDFWTQEALRETCAVV